MNEIKAIKFILELTNQEYNGNLNKVLTNYNIEYRGC